MTAGEKSAERNTAFKQSMTEFHARQDDKICILLGAIHHRGTEAQRRTFRSFFVIPGLPEDIYLVERNSGEPGGDVLLYPIDSVQNTSS